MMPQSTRLNGARGGDVVYIRVNNLYPTSKYRCRFIRVADYDLSIATKIDGGNEYLDADAHLVDYRTINCTTPQWGAVYPGTDVRILLLEDSDGELSAHDRVTAAKFNYSFYEIWDNYVSPMDFGAKGNDTITFSAYGLDSEASYAVAFRDSDGNNFTVAAHAESVSVLTAKSPPWGSFYVEAVANITLYHAKRVGGTEARASHVDVTALATINMNYPKVYGDAPIFVYLTQDNNNFS
jgi:hypothetical protein